MMDVIRLFGPLVLWLGSFSAIYGLQAIMCRQGWDQIILIGAFGLATALQAAVLLGLASRRYGASTAVLRRTSLALGVVGLIAVIWTIAPVVFLPACFAT
jgi:hypothetical protein